MSDGKLKFVIYIDDKGTPVIKDMAGNIKKIEKTTTTATTKMSKGFGSMWKQMALGQVAFAAMRKAVRFLSEGFRSVKDDLLSFDSEFQNVTTLLDHGEEVTFNMKEELIDMAGALGSTTELTKGLYQALSASVEPSEAVEFVGKAAKFAKAGLTDLSTSVDVLTTILNAYGMEADKVTYISDVLFQTIKDGKITGEQLAQSLGQVIPTAASLGISIEEVSAGVATLTKVGIDASTSVVSLNQTMLSILKPTDAAKKAAKELGIEFSRTGMEKAGGFQKYLMLLKEKLEGNAEAMTEMFPNIRALKAAFNLAGTQAHVYAEEMEKMKNVTNNTTEAFDKQMKGYKMMTDAIKNELSAAFQKSLIPVLESVKKYITENKDEIIAFGKKAIAAIMDFGESVVSIIKFLYQFRDVIILAGKAWLLYFAVSKILIWKKAFTTALVAVKAKMLLMNVGLQGMITNFKFLQIRGASAFGALGGSLKYSINKMGAFGKATAIAGAAFVGWKIGELISDLTGLTKHFRELNKQDAIWIENRARENMSEYTKKTSEYVMQIKQLGKEFGVNSKILSVNALAIYKNKEAYDKLEPAIKKIVDGFVKKNKIYIETKKETEKLNTVSKDTNIIIEKTNKILEEKLDILPKIVRFTKEYVSTEEMMIRAANQLFDEMVAGLPVIEETKDKTKEAAKEGMNLADTMQVIANAASALKGLLGKLGIETGGVVDGFINAASGAATFAKSLKTGDIAGMIAGAAQALEGLIAIFESHGIEQAIERENRWMGMNDQLKESLKELSEEIGNTHAATSMMLADIMKDSDITVNNFDKWAGRVKEIFIDLQNGYISVAEFQKTMGSSWNQLVSEAQKLGTEGSAKMLEIIREMETKGLKVAEISEYRIAQLKGTAQAMQDYALAGGKNISTYSGALLGALQAEGASLSEIVEIMGSNLPAGLRKFVDENENVLKGIEASKKMLEGFGNSGYLTQEIFNKLQGDIIKSYDSMTASGENKQQALQAIAPMLAKELWYAQQYNYTLDDKTKKMIEDARAAGINIENMKTEQQLRTEMAHSLKQLVDIMGDFVGATRAGNRELSNMADNARGINFNPGDIPDNRANKGIPEFASGANFTVPSGFERDNFMMGVSSGEHVLVTPKHEAGDSGIKVDKIEVSLVLPNVTNTNTISDLKRGLIMNDQGITTQIIKIAKSRGN